MTKPADWLRPLQALGGRPSERHRLSLERDGRQIDADLPVNAC